MRIFRSWRAAALLLAAGLAWSQAPSAGAGEDPADSAAARADSAALATPDTTRVLRRADTVQVVKHRFNHREQIIAGGVIMASLAAILAVMNNYNPR